jgi:voltage-gated potassium channel
MAWNLSLRRILLSLLLLLGTSGIGVLGFVLLEGYNFVDAIYMTVITMSTVGFGTLTDLSQEGKLFAVGLIIVSAGTFVYAVTTITTFVVEGEIRQVYNLYQITKKVSKLSQHYIICGLGRNGREAALELSRQQHPFVVIESDPEVIEEFISHHNILVIRGDATQEESLEQANIHAARGLITSLSTDAENVYITLTARGMNPNLKIVARASHQSSISKLKRAGANQVIVPNLIGGKRMVNQLTRPTLMEFIDMISGEGNPDLHLEDVACSGHPELLGKNLFELKIRSETGVLVLGFKRGGQSIELNPRADVPLSVEDRLFILGTKAQFAHFRQRFME